MKNLALIALGGLTLSAMALGCLIFWLVMLGMAWLNVWGRDQAER